MLTENHVQVIAYGLKILINNHQILITTHFFASGYEPARVMRCNHNGQLKILRWLTDSDSKLPSSSMVKLKYIETIQSP